MWSCFRTLAHRPPAWLRPIWTTWLLASTRRLLRKEGVQRLVCYDIGARWGIWPKFSELPLPIFKVGFEADPVEAEELRKSGIFDAIVPFALSGKAGKKTLYLARQAGCSSIYGPDLELISEHCDIRDFT